MEKMYRLNSTEEKQKPKLWKMLEKVGETKQLGLIMKEVSSQKTLDLT